MIKFNQPFRNYIESIAKTELNAERAKSRILEKCHDENFNESEINSAIRYFDSIILKSAESKVVDKQIKELGDLDGVVEYALSKQRFAVSSLANAVLTALAAIVFGYLTAKEEKIVTLIWAAVPFAVAKIYTLLGKGVDWRFRLFAVVFVMIGFFGYLHCTLYFYLYFHDEQASIQEQGWLGIFLHSLNYMSVWGVATLAFSIFWAFKFSVIKIDADYLVWTKLEDGYKNFLKDKKAVGSTSNPYQAGV